MGVETVFCNLKTKNSEFENKVLKRTSKLMNFYKFKSFILFTFIHYMFFIHKHDSDYVIDFVRFLFGLGNSAKKGRCISTLICNANL